MKVAILVLGVALSLPATAQNRPAIDVATFTPRGVANAVNETGWKHLGETDDASYWFAYWTGDNSQGTAVVLKYADKSIGDAYTTIKVVTGFADCRGAKAGTYPTYLLNSTVEIDDASTGSPPPGYSDVPMLGSVPLHRGTALAEAVKRTCDAVAQDH